MCDQGITVTYIYIHRYSPQQHIAFYKLDTYRPYSVYRGALSSSHASFFFKKIREKKPPLFSFFFLFLFHFFFHFFFLSVLQLFPMALLFHNLFPSPSIST